MSASPEVTETVPPEHDSARGNFYRFSSKDRLRQRNQEPIAPSNLSPRAQQHPHHSRCDLPAPGAHEVAQVVGLAHAAKPEGGPAATSLNSVTQPWGGSTRPLSADPSTTRGEIMVEQIDVEFGVEGGATLRGWLFVPDMPGTATGDHDGKRPCITRCTHR